MKITDAVHNAGLSIASNLMDASIHSSLGGLGGCSNFSLSEFPESEQPFIAAYVKGDIDSVTAIYLFMKSKEI